MVNIYNLSMSYEIICETNSNLWYIIHFVGNRYYYKRQPHGCLLLVREMGLEPTRLWLDTGTSSLPVCLFQHSRVDVPPNA